MSQANGSDSHLLTTPDHWAASFCDVSPVTSSDRTGWRSGLVRRWTDVSGEISQPPIDHHYVVLHLGGPKHVTRIGAGRTHRTSVAEGALTLVPAGTGYEWITVGPIDFAHLYVHPGRLNSIIASQFDRDPTSVTLDEQVGFEDRLLSELIREMLVHAEQEDGGASGYLDTLFDFAVAKLAHQHSTLASTQVAGRSVRGALAPLPLRRVLECVEGRLAETVSLSELADVAGLSRFHFSRAFQAAMGEPPMAYLAHRRLEVAKRMLRGADLPLAEIGRRSGLGSPSQFASSFRRGTGQTPSSYRRQR